MVPAPAPVTFNVLPTIEAAGMTLFLILQTPGPGTFVSNVWRFKVPLELQSGAGVLVKIFLQVQSMTFI